jgi:hypothetical protein
LLLVIKQSGQKTNKNICKSQIFLFVTNSPTQLN